MARRIVTMGLLVALTCTFAAADVRLSSVLSSGMVVQRDRPIAVWGEASPGEAVAVTFADRRAMTQADDDGRWSVQLDALTAGGPHAMTVRGNNTLELTDVLVGDVWLCAGQSNMQRTLPLTELGDYAIARATHPRLRLLTLDRVVAERPADDAKVLAPWAACTPESVRSMSAVGYYFGVALQAELDVPIGLVNCSWGGTRAEAWTSEPALRANLDLASVFVRAEVIRASPDLDKQRQHLPAHLYNSLIAPLTRLPIAGVIWYQGESNEPWPNEYLALLPALIADWRAQWNQPDLPFGIVQLTAYRPRQTQPAESSRWAMIRDVQRRVSDAVPRVGLAVITDIGNENDIHPANKRDVGSRLALWALAEVYGKPFVAGGPRLRDANVSDGEVVLTFDQIGDGLVARGGAPLRGFAIAGEDRRFIWAEARIDGGRVIVRADDVPRPVAVRYGWSDYPAGNLFNVNGLPASPFRTDDWPTIEDAR